jgi:hypothetical protein
VAKEEQEMKKVLALFIGIGAVLAAGCGKDLPEPEAKAFETGGIAAKNISAAGLGEDETPLFVKYKIHGSDLYIDCIVTGISFREGAGEQQGSILLYADGKKVREVHAASFSVKGLSSGTHKIKVKVVSKGRPAGAEKEFTVKIP